MRTTVTLEPDVEARLKERMRERGISFKHALNDALRDGLSGSRNEPFKTPSWNLGLRPGIDLTKANKLASDLEDDHILRRMREAEREAG